jgi:hypothetical protein
MHPAITREIVRFAQASGDPRPLRESNPHLDVIARLDTYRSVVADMRAKASREGRSMTPTERAELRRLLDDITRLEREEESHRGHQGAGAEPA